MYLISFLVQIIAIIRNIPNQEKSLTDIFVSCTCVAINRRVNEFTNGINENHDILLEKFGHLSEFMNITEAKDCAFFLTSNKRIDVSFFKYALADNLSAGTSEN